MNRPRYVRFAGLTAAILDFRLLDLHSAVICVTTTYQSQKRGNVDIIVVHSTEMYTPTQTRCRERIYKNIQRVTK